MLFILPSRSPREFLEENRSWQNWYIYDFNGLWVKTTWLFVGIFPVWLSKLHSTCPEKKVLIWKSFGENCEFLIFRGLWAETFRLPGYNFLAWSSKMFSTYPRYRFGENEIIRKKHFFSKIFLILLEEISDLWQNFYCMVFETVFDMSSFFVETVYRFWLKNFRTFGKNIFPTVFQIEFDMYRGMFGRKFFCWQQIYREVFRILCVLSKKCRLCCVKTAFYVSRKTFKIVFLISSSVLFTPWLWTKLFRKVDKKPAKLGKTALYVSRRTKWGKTNWKNSFPQFFFQLLLKFFFKGVEIAFYLYSGYFSGKLFLDKKLFL